MTQIDLHPGDKGHINYIDPAGGVVRLPEPDEGMPIEGFLPLSFREKAFFACLALVTWGFAIAMVVIYG